MTQNFYSQDIGLEAKIDFNNEKNIKLIIKNGSPAAIDKIEAIRQWIIKFCMTEKGAYPIYEGTDFGTRFKQLYGKKRIGCGYEEAELERDFREGLILCPAISNVTNFEITKSGKILNIKIEVQLYDGELITADIEKIFIIGG